MGCVAILSGQLVQLAKWDVLAPSVLLIMKLVVIVLLVDSTESLAEIEKASQ